MTKLHCFFSKAWQISQLLLIIETFGQFFNGNL